MGEGRLPHVLSVGWAAIALAPITSGWSAIDRGWTPVVDNGMIAAGAADTFTSEIPLLGMPSSIGYYSGVHVRHPGPLGFWFLALPARVFGAPGYGLVLGCVVLSVACLALVALTLRRTTGPVLEAGFLAATALMILGVGGDRLRDPLNSQMAVLPTLAFFVTAWAVLSGRRAFLPVAVLVGSLAGQLHITNLAIVGSVMALVVVSVARDVAAAEERRPLLTRIVLPSVALGVLAWVGPIIDQLAGNRNLGRLVRSSGGSDTEVSGLRFGVERTLDMVGVPPRWALGRLPLFFEVDPSPLKLGAGAAWLALVGASLVLAARRRDRPLAALCAIGLVVTAVVGYLGTRIPIGEGQETFAQYAWPWWPVGVIVAVAGCWSVAQEIAPLVERRGRALSPGVAVVGALVVALPAAVAAHHPLDPDTEPASGLFGSTRVHAQAILDIPEVADGVVLELDPPRGEPLGPDLVLYGHADSVIGQLRLEGVDVRLVDEERENDYVLYDYRARHPATGEEAVHILLRVGTSAPPEGYRLLSSYDPAEPVESYEGYSVPLFFAVPTTVFVRIE